MTSLRLAPFVLLLSAGAVHAAPVVIDVRGPDGLPLAGAVVSLENARFGTAPPRGPYAIEQRNISFQPHVLVVPVGAIVSFPNRDRVRHHVYSFSHAKKFDLKLYGREERRTVTFDKAGAIALGCNIHDQMSGFVYVAATPFADQVDAAGRTSFADVPAGVATLRVWHPSIRSRDNSLARAITVAPDGFATTVSITR